MFHEAVADIIGVKPLATRIAELGPNTRLAKPDEFAWLESDWLTDDRHLIALSNRPGTPTDERCPIHLVTMMMKGGVGFRQNLGARTGTLKIGPIPVTSRKLIPVQYHFVVQHGRGEAKLVRKTKGLLYRNKAGAAWTGGDLADRLNRDSRLTRSFDDLLTLDEKLRVEPGKDFVRIVLQRAMLFNFTLAKADLVDLERPLLSRALWNGLIVLAHHTTAT